jgi:hypothetical protein
MDAASVAGRRVKTWQNTVMLPCLLRRVAEFCENPQDLLTRDDVAAFLESEYGLALEDAHCVIDWLIRRGHLRARTHRGYVADVAAVIDRTVLLADPSFGRGPTITRPNPVTVGGIP